MLFKDVIGQPAAKQNLIEMVEHNRLSHALLFLGKEGSGALPLALAFSQYVSLLPVRDPAGNAGVSLFGTEVQVRLPATPNEADAWMQSQPSFSKAQGMVHPDIHYSYPVVTRKAGSPPLSVDYSTEWREFIEQLPYGNIYDWLQFIGAENKQGNITAQECNDIIHKLSLKSFESGYKVLLMWMPEYLGKEGNKLLKLIEEPPADTLFILVAENEGQIISTILSRCQLVRIPALETIDIEKALLDKNAGAPERIRIIAGNSGGNYREAIQLLQNGDEDFYSLLRDWLNATLRHQVVILVRLIEDIARLGREKQKQFLRYFTHLLEQAVRIETMGVIPSEKLQLGLVPSEAEFIGKLNKAMSLEQKEAVSQELDEAAYHIERNANAKILFHALSIKIFHIVKNNIVVEG